MSTGNRVSLNIPRRLQGLHLSSVLAATDFSPASDRAVAEAISIARHYGAKLYVLNIVSSLGFNLSGAGAMAVAAKAAWRDMARLEDDLSRSRLLQGVDASFVVRSGCVVRGSRGHSAARETSI